MKPRSDKGSIAPLVAGYLSLILLVLFGSAAVGVSMIATNRVQAITDAALLYAHDRSHQRGVPSERLLEEHTATFLFTAPSAKRIQLVSFDAWSSQNVSNLRLCARVQNPLWTLGSLLVCREAKAESFIVR